MTPASPSQLKAEDHFPARDSAVTIRSTSWGSPTNSRVTEQDAGHRTVLSGRDQPPRMPSAHLPLSV